MRQLSMARTSTTLLATFLSRLAYLLLATALGACSSSSPAPHGSGGNSASGGVTSAGGLIGAGGAAETGGIAGYGGSSPSGGVSESGGTTASGGVTSSGGATAPAGATGKGGATATGGTVATGGAVQTGGSSGSGGGTSTGGASATGGTGGTSDTGGTTGTGGSAQPPVTCTPDYTGSDTRPQLTDAAAACYTIKTYLVQAGTIGSLVRDDWDPSAAPLTAPASPTYTVAADGSGTHTSVQAAITAALAAGGTARVYILVKTGTYRELVCVKPASGVTAIPLTLYGADSDASKVTIVYNNGSGVTVTADNTNPCSTPSGTTHGTSDSSTVIVSTRQFQAMNLTIANDFAEPSGQSAVQAPAMTVQADQLVFQNVRLLGNQDTLQLKTTNVTTVARSYFKSCYVEGDVDFIFGRGTAVFDGCTIQYLTARKSGSTVFAPSTEGAHPFGMLVIGSQIGSYSGTNSTYLGRAWDDSSGTSPNGQIVIRESALDASIRSTAPWTTSTQGRAYSASGNRMYEYKNTGAGAAP
jgi:pectinesterase